MSAAAPVDGRWRERCARGVSWIEAPLLAAAGLRHGFTTRRGGVSEGPFASLDFTSRQGDDPARVRENWRRLCEAADLSRRRWALLQQVHGARVVEARSGGAPTPGRAGCPAADGVFTREPGLVSGVLAADCLPLLLFAPGGETVAAVHAGWRGTAAGIAGAAVGALAAAGVEPGRLRAAVGPAIGPCCYEVGEEVLREFVRRRGEEGARAIFRVAGRPHLDLQAENLHQLAAAGVKPARTAVVPLCTRCRADLFFSHRRDGARTGRMLAFAAAGGEETR